MNWKLALAQHPMYILIKEDTLCAERTPPWGAPSIESYHVRLRQNIAVLRKHPQIKIGYEWSGLELELLKDEAPEIFDDMLDLVKAGQSTFYNGTYSQPHLQTLSSEANYRQFEWGARVYKELCDHQVLVYAHQESSLNEQTPQLLKAFGIRYGALPHFSSTLKIFDGGEILFHSRFGTMFMHGEEFAGWEGLDGTVLDLYLQEPNHMRIREWINFQEMLGICHVPPVMVEIPDLIDVDEEWVDERAQADFSLLDDILEERRKIAPPRFQVRFYTNWSYIEGIRAEELSRGNWNAEVSALRAEALNSLAYVLLKRAPQSTDPAWKKILTTQHHDVYCFCAPELRDKSVRWLKETFAETESLSEAAAQAVVAQVNTSGVDGQPLVVFNTVPHKQKSVVTVEVDATNPQILDASGNTLPYEAIPVSANRSQVRFLAELSGLGFSTFQVTTDGNKPTEEIYRKAYVFENRFYRATVQPDGTFTSLLLLPSGDELLEGAANPGNMLTARDSTGLGPKHEGTFDVTKWEKWEPSGRGPELTWKPISAAHVQRSSIGTTFLVDGEMGSNVKATLSVCFYEELPQIDLDWSFTFSEASIGHFFDDDTKLRVLWPLGFTGEIHHDISFGVVDTRTDRPFFPASWVDVSDGTKGLAYFHQGTLKHWVAGNTLVNLFAWGEDTDAIGNRLDLVRWPKCFDQRLRGTHTIRAAIYPHNGDWRTADLIGAARSYGTPPMAIVTDSHPGTLPSEMDILSFADAEIAATSVKVEGEELVCRLYSVKAQAAGLKPALRRLEIEKMHSLGGKSIDEVKPYKIAHLILKPVR